MGLRTARKQSGKTQARVAEESNIPENTYQSYEYEKREPGVRVAIRIADALGVESYEAFKDIFG